MDELDSMFKALPFIAKIGAVLAPLISQVILVFFQRKKPKMAEEAVRIGSICSSYEVSRNIIKNNLLRDSMNFAEARIQVLENNLISLFKENSRDFDYSIKCPLNDHCEIFNNESNRVSISMFKSALHVALDKVGNELRRSFRENGYHDLSSIELDAFVTSKSEQLMSIALAVLYEEYSEGIGIIPLRIGMGGSDKQSIIREVRNIYLSSLDFKSAAAEKDAAAARKLEADLCIKQTKRK